MRRVVQGDAGAFDALFARHVQFVRTRLARIVRDEAAADDLVQDVFLRLWTRAAQWDGRGSLRAWLARIATNLALNHLRSRRRRPQQPLEPLPRPDAEDEENLVPGWMIDAAAVAPDAAAELAERVARFRGLLEGLSDEQREVYRLVHEEDMAIREAAEQLGIPEGTVKSRLHYAAKRLARRWQQLEAGSESEP